MSFHHKHRDPHIKVVGKPGNVSSAKDKIMSVLDTKSNRVTLKMDVSYTEHSHVIGKGGNIIKKVMEDTGCHIHFPDSNRGTQQEKSNQVSIAGQVGGVEKARCKIRELLPLVLFFELPITGTPVPDMNSPTIQQIVQSYNVAVNMKQRSRGFSTTVTVRGAANNAAGLKEGTVRLMEHLTGSLGMTLPVSAQIEIAPQHHQFMIGRGGLNIKQIMQGTGATIHFPDPNNALRKSSVFISGSVDSVIVARHLLMGCLPLVLMFDIKEEVEVESSKLAQMMEHLDVFISVKPKPKQPSKSVIVKSIERNAPNMYMARQKLLGQECESCAANHAGHQSRGLNGTTLPLAGLNVGSIGGILNQGSIAMNAANLLSLNRLNGLNAAAATHPSATNTTPATTNAPPWVTSSNPVIQHQGLQQTTVPPSLIPQQALNSLLHHSSNQIQVNHPAGLIPTTLTPTISTSLTPGLTTTSLTPRLPCSQPTPGMMPTNTLATSLATDADTTALQNRVLVPTSLSATPINGGVHTSTAPAAPSIVTRPSVPSQMRLPVSMSNSLLQAMTQAALSSGIPPPLNMSTQPPPFTHTASPPLQTSEGGGGGCMPSLSGGALPTSCLTTGLTPTSPPSIPMTQASLPHGLPPPPDLSSHIPSLLPPTNTTSVSSMPPPPPLLHPQQSIPSHKPPPGFSPRPDPAAVSAQLAQLDMRQKIAHSGNSEGAQLPGDIRHSAFVRVPSALNNDIIGVRQRHSASPTPTSHSSPSDHITTATTSALKHLLNNNNKADMLSKNHPSSTTLIELLSRNHSISPNNSGNFASVFGPGGPMQQISPSNSGNFAARLGQQISPSNSGNFSSRLGQQISPSNSGNFSSVYGSGGGVQQQDQNGLNRSGSRPSSESGAESDSSDKRAPGCERRERERERQWERERELEQQRQQELDGLMQDDPAFSYEQKKMLASKAMKKKPVVTQPRTPTDTWSGLGFSKSMPESAILEARAKNGFALFQRPALPTMHESSVNEEEESAETENTWPSGGSSAESQQNSSGDFMAPRKKKFPYSSLSCSNYIESSSLPRTTRGLWSHQEQTSSVSDNSSNSTSSSTDSNKQDLSELFTKLGLTKYTNVFQQQEIDLGTFSTLTDNDLKELGINTFGARRKMLLAIADLNKGQTKSYHTNGNNGYMSSSSVDQINSNHYTGNHGNMHHRNNIGGYTNPSTQMNEATTTGCW